MNSNFASKGFFYALLIFVAGFASGVVFAPHIGRALLRPPPPGNFSRHMLQHLESQLQLTDEQRKQIEPILEKTNAHLESIRHETSRQVAEAIAQTNASVAQFLTPEQQQKFEAMEAERRAHMHRGDLAPSPPPPPPR